MNTTRNPVQLYCFVWGFFEVQNKDFELTLPTFVSMFQYEVSLDKGKFASLTIRGVSMEDSGKYSMIVQNKYGGESVAIVVGITEVQITGFIRSFCSEAK